MSDRISARVEYDKIEFDDQLALCDGKPFSGVIFADYPSGQTEILYRYERGLPSGLQQRWYSNGQLEEEWEAVRGSGALWSKKWYENGQMQSERVNDANGTIRIMTWSESGDLQASEAQR